MEERKSHYRRECGMGDTLWPSLEYTICPCGSPSRTFLRPLTCSQKVVFDPESLPGIRCDSLLWNYQSSESPGSIMELCNSVRTDLEVLDPCSFYTLLFQYCCKAGSITNETSTKKWNILFQSLAMRFGPRSAGLSAWMGFPPRGLFVAMETGRAWG